MNNQQNNQPAASDIPKRKMKFSTKVIIFTIAIILLCAIAILLFINLSSSSKGKDLQEQLELGEQYLSELDYEQAIVAYEAAITIDPQSVDACLGLADTYIALGDYDEALLVLERNYSLSNDSSVAKKINTVKALIDKQNGIVSPDADNITDNTDVPTAPVLTATDIQNKYDIVSKNEASKVAGTDYTTAATVATLGKVPNASITYVGMGGHGSPIGMGVHFQSYTVGVQANPVSGYKYARCESDTIQFSGSVYNSHLGQNVPTYTVPESGHHFIYVYYEPVN